MRYLILVWQSDATFWHNLWLFHPLIERLGTTAIFIPIQDKLSTFHSLQYYFVRQAAAGQRAGSRTQRAELTSWQADRPSEGAAAEWPRAVGGRRVQQQHCTTIQSTCRGEGHSSIVNCELCQFCLPGLNKVFWNYSWYPPSLDCPLLNHFPRK